MIAIEVSVLAIDQLANAIGANSCCMINPLVGNFVDDYRKSISDALTDGRIPRLLEFDLDIEPLTVGDRWDSEFSRITCDTIEAVSAVCCEIFGGANFLWVSAGKYETEFWCNRLKEVVSFLGYSAVDEVFRANKNAIAEMGGIQVWSPQDVGIGEMSSDRLVVTGSIHGLRAFEKRFSNSPKEFITSYVNGTGSLKWFDLE